MHILKVKDYRLYRLLWKLYQLLSFTVTVVPTVVEMLRIISAAVASSLPSFSSLLVLSSVAAARRGSVFSVTKLLSKNDEKC